MGVYFAEALPFRLGPTSTRHRVWDFSPFIEDLLVALGCFYSTVELLSLRHTPHFHSFFYYKIWYFNGAIIYRYKYQSVYI